MDELKHSILRFIGNGEVATKTLWDGVNTGNSVSIGRLYVALGELEDASMVQRSERPGGASRGYRAVRVYRLTGHGLAELRQRA